MSFRRIFLSLCTILLLAGNLTTQALALEEGLQICITQVDNSHFPKVTVYISVTSANREPAGVEASQIQLYEDGVLIQPEKVLGAGETGPLTTLLVMDVSGSMANGGKLETAKVAASAYVAQMRPTDKTGLISYNTQVTVAQPITSNQLKLDDAIESLNAKGDTAMYDALLKAVAIFSGETGRKAIIVLTDGLDNRSTARAKDVAAAVGPGGVSISTIGLGDPAASVTNDGLDEAGLRSLAKAAGGLYSYAADTASLQTIYESYGRALHSEYAITYTSPSALRDGVNRNLSVSVGEAGMEADTAYNPGGVLPEVASKNWPLFGGVLAGLVGLAFLPGIIDQVKVSSERNSRNEIKKRSRIKLK